VTPVIPPALQMSFERRLFSVAESKIFVSY